MMGSETVRETKIDIRQRVLEIQAAKQLFFTYDRHFGLDRIMHRADNPYNIHTD